MKPSRSELPFLGLVLALTAVLAFAAPAAEDWENNCASCHGADGRARTKQGKKLKIRDYTDPKVQAEMRDEDMLKAILDGVTANGKERMKGYRDELSEEEAKALVEYIRQMKK